MLSFACSNGVPCSSAATGSMRRAAIAMPRCALLPAAACTLLAMPATTASADVVVEGDQGSATVGEILGKPAIFRAEERTERKSFQFYMPPGAKQGPDIWYLSRTNVAVTFARGSNQGSVLVTATVSGTSTAQVQFYPTVTSSGRQVVEWATADLIRGSHGGRVLGSTALVKHTNYLIAKAVKGGWNNLTFQVTRLGGAEVEKVEIGPASGVYASEVGWVELDLHAQFVEQELEVGEEATLEVSVRNSSLRKAKEVSVVVQPRSEDLFIRGPIAQSVQRLTGTATRRFVVGASKPGMLKVSINAVDPESGEEPKALASVRVVEGQDGLGNGWRILIVACLLGALGGIASLQRRGRA